MIALANVSLLVSIVLSKNNTNPVVDIRQAEDSADEGNLSVDEYDIQFCQLFLEANDRDGVPTGTVVGVKGYMCSTTAIPLTTSVVKQPKFKHESSTSTTGHF